MIFLHDAPATGWRAYLLCCFFVEWQGLVWQCCSRSGWPWSERIHELGVTVWVLANFTLNPTKWISRLEKPQKYWLCSQSEPESQSWKSDFCFAAFLFTFFFITFFSMPFFRFSSIFVRLLPNIMALHHRWALAFTFFTWSRYNCPSTADCVILMRIGNLGRLLFPFSLSLCHVCFNHGGVFKNYFFLSYFSFRSPACFPG